MRKVTGIRYNGVTKGWVTAIAILPCRLLAYTELNNWFLHHKVLFIDLHIPVSFQSNLLDYLGWVKTWKHIPCDFLVPLSPTTTTLYILSGKHDYNKAISQFTCLVLKLYKKKHTDTHEVSNPTPPPSMKSTAQLRHS